MAFETRMLQECTDFWTNHVETNVPPPFDDGKGTQAYLRLVHGEVRLEGVGLRLKGVYRAAASRACVSVRETSKEVHAHHLCVDTFDQPCCV